MNVSLFSTVAIDLAANSRIQLDFKSVFALYLFTTKWGWTKENPMQLRLHLAKSIYISDSESRYPGATFDQIYVYGDARTASLIFSFNKENEFSLDRLDLQSRLESLLVERFGPQLSLPAQSSLDKWETCETPKNFSALTGQEINGKPIYLHIDRLTVTLAVDRHGLMYSIVDTELFMSNVNLERPTDVKHIGFESAVFLGGGFSKETKESINVWLQPNNVQALEVR